MLPAIIPRFFPIRQGCREFSNSLSKYIFVIFEKLEYLRKLRRESNNINPLTNWNYTQHCFCTWSDVAIILYIKKFVVVFSWMTMKLSSWKVAFFFNSFDHLQSIDIVIFFRHRMRYYLVNIIAHKQPKHTNNPRCWTDSELFFCACDGDSYK